jgi:YggT family protein
MSVLFIVQLIGLITDILVLLIFIWAILSWILPPYHPVREALDRIMGPLLAPIRRVVPLAGMIDFSPMILMILIEIISRVLIYIILSL